METQLITTPNPDRRIANIIEEIRRTCIEDVDAEVIEDILLRELNEYCRMLDEYYLEEYHNAMYSVRNSAYDYGRSDGYADGYDEGYASGYSKSHSAV